MLAAEPDNVVPSTVCELKCFVSTAAAACSVGASLPAVAPEQLQPAEPAPQPAAQADESLLAKTIGIKDRVVAATQHAVSATIGVVPSWFGSLGDRIGGDGQHTRAQDEGAGAERVSQEAASAVIADGLHACSFAALLMAARMRW